MTRCASYAKRPTIIWRMGCNRSGWSIRSSRWWDGANPFQVFYRIYLPLISGGLAVSAVLTFNFHWNEFFRPLVFMISQEKFTIPLGLFNLQGYMMTGSISVVLAGIGRSMIPVMIVYLFGQRYLIEGIMMGGLNA